MGTDVNERGAFVKNCIRMGDGAVVDMGAFVTKDILY